MNERTSITVSSPAKINLTFEILGLLPDGYHDVRTLMQSVSLCDELTFEISPAREPALNISLARGSGAWLKEGSEQNEFPTGDGNLIAKALRLFLSSIDRPRALKVDVQVLKNVPIGAGLAGGSGNAAAALLALNEHFGSPLEMSKLTELGAKLGADVPFCLKGGRQLGLGRGDMLEAIDMTRPAPMPVPETSDERPGTDSEPNSAAEPNSATELNSESASDRESALNNEGAVDKRVDDDLHFVLAKARHLSIATPWAYQGWDQKVAAGEIMSLAEKVKDRGIDALPCDYAVDCLRSGDLKEALRAFGNDFEQVVFPHYKQLKEIKTRFTACGALACHMTGSGPTIYALAESAEHAKALVDEFRRRETSDQNSITCAAKFDQIDLYPVHSLLSGARVVHAQNS